MNSVSNVLQMLPNVASAEVAPVKADPGTVQVINSLFRELMAIFPAWKQAWPDKEATSAAKATWTKAFMAEKITTIEQIRFGIEQCRKLGSDFAPSVGKFINLCQPTPEMLGLPPLETAFREACRNVHPSMAGQANWSHDAIWHTAKESGFESLNRLETSLSRKLFERNYVITVRRLIDGLPLQKMPLALPARVDGRRTPEVGNRALAELRAMRSGGVRHA
ncbi:MULTISPECIES: replication protein P [Pseudomonas]|uniref:replication protein P n=1 Tax=Pseudomonas TaxID=286 RepID=UPI0010710BAC|nr:MULTISPECIES: replication protein P [Pseudomonas]QBR32849.1 Replication protein P [Pseudomonas sp. S150]UZT91030.1 replication protein P [Pseudomonas koreensis]